MKQVRRRADYKTENRRRATGNTPLHYCSKCDLWKLFEEFNKDARLWDGLGNRCKTCNRARTKAWTEANHERHLATNKAWRAANRDRNAAKDKARYEANREHVLATNKAWHSANPERSKQLGTAKNSARRARKKAATGKFTAADWRALVARSPHCHWCGRKWTKTLQPTHDHVISLLNKGVNGPENSVCACLSCNSRKSATRMNPNTKQGILL